MARRVILLDKRPGDLLMELEELGKNELLILGRVGYALLLPL